MSLNTARRRLLPRFRSAKKTIHSGDGSGDGGRARRSDGGRASVGPTGTLPANKPDTTAMVISPRWPKVSQSK